MLQPNLLCGSHKNFTKTAKNFAVFMAKVSLLINKYETDFQSFLPAIHHWKMRLNQDGH